MTAFSNSLGARLPWLLIGLMGGILVAQVIALYEEQLRIDPKLAFFIPLIAAMGGNVGVQSSAIVVQGLANHSIQLQGIFGRLRKELGVAMINATVLCRAHVRLQFASRQRATL